MNPRKADIQQWRELFAQKLRENGIEANATSRTVRGKLRKSEKQAIRHIERTGRVSTVRAGKREAVVAEIQTGKERLNPLARNILQTRENVVKAYGQMAYALTKSVEKPDINLGLQVMHFIKTMKPPLTAHQEAVLAYKTRSTNQKREVEKE